MFDLDSPFPQAISAFVDCSEAAAANFQEAGTKPDCLAMIFQEAGTIPDCHAAIFL
jgi:hypothetical protein